MNENRPVRSKPQGGKWFTLGAAVMWVCLFAILLAVTVRLVIWIWP